MQLASSFVAHHRRSMALYRHDADDVMLMPGPLFHEAPALFSLAQLFFGGTIRNWQLTLPDFGTVQGPFQIVALEFAADHAGEVTFDLALESAGEVTFTAI